jgi:hypothetical protein
MGRVPKASSKFECLSSHLADRSFADPWTTLLGKLARLEAGGDLLRMFVDSGKAPKSKKNPRDVQNLKENATDEKKVQRTDVPWSWRLL